MRAARHRASYAVKLGALVALFVSAAGLAGLAALGRLGEASEAALAIASKGLTETGHTLVWLDVVGAERLDPSAIALIVGASPGVGLADIDIDMARAGLEAQGWVKTAKVMRLWPDRLAVIIEERVPRALWQFEESFQVIDADGVVIDGADPSEFLDLPRVVGAEANTDADAVISLISAYPEIASRTTHAIKVGERRWSLRLASGGEILLPQDDPASALATLSALHAERGVLDYEAQVFDVRNPGEMVMRPWPDRAAEAAGRGA